MADEIIVAKVVDARNQYCPFPIVQLSSAIKDVSINEIVEVLATDPGTLADVPNWALSTGNEVVKQTIDGETIKFWVKRRV
jgi:tRNA 2-thiouridine synthesizing protein A